MYIALQVRHSYSTFSDILFPVLDFPVLPAGLVVDLAFDGNGLFAGNLPQTYIEGANFALVPLDHWLFVHFFLLKESQQNQSYRKEDKPDHSSHQFSSDFTFYVYSNLIFHLCFHDIFCIVFLNYPDHYSLVILFPNCVVHYHQYDLLLNHFHLCK